MSIFSGMRFRPRILDLFKKGGYDKDTFLSDLIAGIIVGIIALPLAIAFGIASGVSPTQGLITAIVAGFLMSMFGGSHFLVGGPTGAFIVIVYGIIQQYGMSGLIIATTMAGIILVLMGIFKLGSIIKFIPYPIVVGFTSGIAVTIFTTQVKDFFGMRIAEVPAGFIEQWGCYFQNIGSIQLHETLLALGCLLIIIFWSKVTKKIPGSLIAIIVGTVASVLLSKYAGLDFATIGSKFPELANGVTIPKPSLPDVSFEVIQDLVSPAFTIAILCAIESLLAAMVADGVTGKKHDSNTELIGQGIANIVTPFFGGIPATGAIARTMANINNGGKTPMAGIIHAAVLLMILVILMPYAVHIPFACLAAILIMVAYNMSEWRTFRDLLKADRSDVAVLLITFFLTVIIDLTVAIEVGLLLAVLLFIKRISESSSIKVLEKEYISATEDEERAEAGNIEHLDVHQDIEVYEIEGPFFFGLASRIDELDNDLKKSNIRVRIIRMRKVPLIDTTGVKNLRNLYLRSKKEKIQMILSGVNDNVLSTLQKTGLAAEIGEEYIFPHIVPALDKANEIIGNQK